MRTDPTTPADPAPGGVAGHRVVRLANGTWSIHADAEGEVFHPVVGPACEAESLYVNQLRLRERMAPEAPALVVWDVGLGGAANALALLRGTRECRRPLHLVSFDHTLAPLELARREAVRLVYPAGYEGALDALLRDRTSAFRDGAHEVTWQVLVGDFPAWLAAGATNPPAVPAPDAILFDPFSPGKNPAMWSRPTLAGLFQRLQPGRPCALATFSRSTAIRVAFLAAGWFVGKGMAIGAKEESTIAASDPALVPSLLDHRWLERARRSHAAEPWDGPVHRQAPLTEATWELLRRHPQFQAAQTVTGSESPAG